MALTGSSVSLSGAQSSPKAADHPWDESSVLPGLQSEPPARYFTFDRVHVYSLADLIDAAEVHNPVTREAWALARKQADQLGIDRADLFPSLLARVLGGTSKNAALINDVFAPQTIGDYNLSLNLSYTLLDFGERRGRIDRSRALVIASNLQFNQTHLNLIKSVMLAFYQLLKSQGDVEAAEADLKAARTIREASEQRLALGIATVPDVMEAKSIEARALYDLHSAHGARQIASGDLATLITAPPNSRYKVQSLEELDIPHGLDESAEKAISDALSNRQDVLARTEDLRAAKADIVRAQSSWYPRLVFNGNEGYRRAFGQQTPFQSVYASGSVYEASLSLDWRVFDGGRRRHEVDQAHAEAERAQAVLDHVRDEATNQVWHAYTDVETAFQKREAAAALLTASIQSYEAALESYRLGLRDLVDLLNAERILADARSTDVTARVQVLTSLSDLAYSTGSLLNRSPRRPLP